ncbi:MAG: tRNA (N(6)-L-threonylcarbamoyladenosine(37)-C(2))-methylthiotransferase [Candidatus Bathyarchaeota archaeon]|nr:tRNA (N(6)-L-threonylcarbamoyladenosine(37)-C(2))-methylthiotransferase [Candidatus Bathyarchaeota archaeon]
MIKKVFIKSFGCATNIADGEVMAGCLAKAGYKIVPTVDEAEVVIYNTCAVKSPTENRIMGILRANPKDKKLIVAGCLPLINFERLKREVKFDGVVGPSPGELIVDVVRMVENGENPIILRNDLKPNLLLPRIPIKPVIRIIPISYGCLGSCTYCCVRFARGKLRSYCVEEILEEVKNSLKEGVKEFWFTSQDLAAYGKDIGVSLVDLLEKLLSLNEKFFIRLGMMNPNNVAEILDELIKFYKDKRIFKFLHLPLQSGDNKVLKDMNRFYTVEDYSKIVYSMRGEIENLTLATDVICGFPTETVEAFENTLKLIKELKPDIVNISKFYSRPKTIAGKIKPLPTQEVKRRSEILTKLTAEISLKNNLKWVGWAGYVLIDERGLKCSWIGRNTSYKPIVIRLSYRDDLMGRCLKVLVKKAFINHLDAEVLSKEVKLSGNNQLTYTLNKLV